MWTSQVLAQAVCDLDLFLPASVNGLVVVGWGEAAQVGLCPLLPCTDEPLCSQLRSSAS